MSRLTTIAMTAVLAFPAFAQEQYWIANRASNDIMQVTAWGSVVRRIAMPTSLRSCFRAPDGKIWVVRFIQGTFDIVDPVTSSITPIASASGSPFAIAFDRNGHAWITGGSNVQEFDANGTLLNQYPLTVAAPLGITIDNQGNKWIAHRVTPGSLSRIDPTGVVMNFTIVGSTFQPVGVVADYRGLLVPSHLWVTGDGPSQLAEVDTNGNTLNVYTLPIGSTGISPVTDLAGNVWAGSFGTTGALMQVSSSTGAVLNQYLFPPAVLGVAIDSFGRLLLSERITFSGVGPPCELRRVNPTTGALEVNTQLAIGGFSASGTQSAASTPQQFALVVDPLGDLDGDGDANYTEIVNGTSATDPCSNSQFSANTTGTTSIGSTASIDVQIAPGNFWMFAFALGVVAPGSGIHLPGFACEMLLDPLTALPGTLSGVGPTNYPVAIPSNPALQGFTFYMQGFAITGSTFRFTNVTGMRVW
jgi:streptogramin lyase